MASSTFYGAIIHAQLSSGSDDWSRRTKQLTKPQSLFNYRNIMKKNMPIVTTENIYMIDRANDQGLFRMWLFFFMFLCPMKLPHIILMNF